MDTRRSVRDANKILYDSIAPSYDSMDGRRSRRLEEWIRQRLLAVRSESRGGRLLDLGSGSGFVTRAAGKVFERRVALDISHNILALNKGSSDYAVAGDVDSLPFRERAFDAVSCFSALHHLFDFELLVKEITRVLRPGGIFYSDHDMDSVFASRFALPRAVYHKFRDPSGRYASPEGPVTKEVYKKAEYQEKGIDSRRLAVLLAQAGFSARLSFHWYGLNPVTDLLFGVRSFPQGLAPLCSISAVKMS